MEINKKHSVSLASRATQVLSAAAIAILAFAQPLQAQLPGPDIRVGIHTAEPTNGFGNGYDNGFGLYARIGAPMGPISLMGAATWTRFSPESSLFRDLDIITLQFGPHLMLIPGLDVGIEGAYFTEVEDFGFVPVISFGIPNLEANLAYNTTFDGPKTSWFSLGIGFKF